jgi:hypothetical protein
MCRAGFIKDMVRPGRLRIPQRVWLEWSAGHRV